MPGTPFWQRTPFKIQGPWIHHWYLRSFFLLASGSDKSQVLFKNLSKVHQKHLRRNSLLKRIKVFNQDLSIWRKTGTALVLKLHIDFITLWNDPMQDSRVTITNIFELFRHWLTDYADNNWAEWDGCGEWERRIFCNITLLG